MGELKPGWKRVKFGDVVRQVKEKADPATSGLERFIAGEHMDTDDLCLRRWGDIGDGYLGPAFHARFRAGQVLYGSRRTYLRKVAVADFDGICANTTFVLESKNPKELLPELLPFVMQTEAFHEHSKRESKGSVNPYVNFSDIAWYEFALPPPKEQRRIASWLRASADEAAALSDLTNRAENLRRSFLVSVFRPNRGNRDEYPSNWSVGTVDDVGEVQLGQKKDPSVHHGANMREYLRVANVFDDEFDLSDVLSMHFADRDLPKYRLRDGDILLNEGQSPDLLGRSAIWRNQVPEMYFQMTLLRFRAGPAVSPEFAHAFFQHMLYTKQFAKDALQTTSIAHLSASKFGRMTFPIPPTAEQSDFLADYSRLRDTCARCRIRLVALKGVARASASEAFSA